MPLKLHWKFIRTKTDLMYPIFNYLEKKYVGKMMISFAGGNDTKEMNRTIKSTYETEKISQMSVSVNFIVYQNP